MLIGSRQKLNTLTVSPVLNINGTLCMNQGINDVKISWCTH